MIETTTIHFTGMGLLLSAIAPCLIAFFLWLVRRRSPEKASARASAGFFSWSS